MRRVRPQSVIVILVSALAPALAQRPADVQRAGQLIEALASDDLGKVNAAVDDLVGFGAPAVEALVAHLKLHVKTPTPPRSCAFAVRALTRLGKPAAGAVPTLLRFVPNAERSLQTDIAVALGRLASYAPAHVDDVREAMLALLDQAAAEDTGGLASVGVFHLLPEEPAWAYAAAGVDAGGPIEKLAAALRDDNPMVRDVAVGLLRERGGDAVVAVPALLEAMDAEHPPIVRCGRFKFDLDLTRHIRHRAARALAAIAADDPRVVPAHAIVLELSFPEERQASVMALGRLGAAAAPAVPAMVALLREDVLEVRRETITALGMIGAAAKAAVPELEKLAADGDPQIAERAKAALRQIRE